MPESVVLRGQRVFLHALTQARAGTSHQHGVGAPYVALVRPGAARIGRCSGIHEVRATGRYVPHTAHVEPGTVWMGYNASNNPNRGFLSDMQCPFCGGYGPFHALITHWAKVDDNEIRPDQPEPSDPDVARKRRDQLIWNDDDDVICTECGWRRPYSHFDQAAD